MTVYDAYRAIMHGLWTGNTYMPTDLGGTRDHYEISTERVTVIETYPTAKSTHDLSNVVLVPRRRRSPKDRARTKQAKQSRKRNRR